MTNKNTNFISQDLSIIFFSILFALILIKTSALSVILDGAIGLRWLGSFVAGMFFTSVFTTTPAIISLGTIASKGSILSTAFFGALGAVVGDLVIFRFIRDRLSDHLTVLMEHTSYWKRVKALFRLRYFRWGTFLLGGLIISSPLPDEIAISLMGLTKMNTRTFIPISFAFNFIGILIIGFVARAI